MHDNDMTLSNQYWLHVPLETTPGRLLEVPLDKRLTVLGRKAQLFDREPQISFLSFSTMVIKQWLLFEPLSELETQSLFSDLRARMPALSMNMGANFRIPSRELYTSTLATYDGSVPTLIPANLDPAPIWHEAMGTCSWSGQHVLEAMLQNSEPVTDDRILAALELFISSQYDILPRSIFLAKLTILDALATKEQRNADTTAWLDAKIAEAAKFEDHGLSSALANLKFESHSAAIRSLVRRAVLSLGGTAKEAELQMTAVGKLYAARSRLSHGGGAETLDLGAATQLSQLVLNAVIQNPAIINERSNRDSVSASHGHQIRQRWVAEAEAAIHAVEPDAAAVVDAARRPLVLGDQGVLSARLADGSEWYIRNGTAQQLSAEEIAGLARFESLCG